MENTPQKQQDIQMQHKEVIASIDTMMREYKKLQGLKERYVEHAKTLSEAVKVIDEQLQIIANISKEIDPVADIMDRQRQTRVNFTTIKQELLGALQKNVYISMDYIKKSYPDLTENNVMHLFYGFVAKLPTVSKGKDMNGKVAYHWNNITSPTFDTIHS